MQLCPKRVSLLATTINRKEPLIRLLDSLVAQSYPHFTLFLGDQNPHGYLEMILGRYQSKLDIRYYPMRPQSLSSARNVLLPEIEGEIFALPDDDCHYLPDTLEKVARIFSMNENVDGLIGCPRHDAPSGILKQENRYTLFRRTPSWLLFFRSEVAKAVGNFDENLGIGAPTPFQSGEETDYLLRTLGKGFNIYRSDEVLVWHPPLDEKHADLTKSAGYAHGRMALLQKHNFPLWFKVLNVINPLCHPQLLFAWKYRTAVFHARLQGLFMKRFAARGKKEEA